MYDTIRKLILAKNQDIDEETLMYYCNYFYVVVSRKVIPDGVTLDELIDNVLRIDKIIFFKDDDPIAKKYGNDFKGYRDSKAKILYVRDSLPAELREMVIYHEIHHAVQTGEDMMKSEKCGINQEENLGRLIMEAQTEWFAEEIYKTIHNVSFEEKLIPSEKLRMEAGQTICSSLHNYEMYDALLSKLAIIMGVPKEYFVKINFMYKNNEGIKKLREDYERAILEKEIPISFDMMMRTFDYAYVVDFTGYVDNVDHDLVLAGGVTATDYVIYTNWGNKLSQHNQASYLKDFDNKVILSLLKNGISLESIEYAKYIFDNKNRKIIGDYIKSKQNDTKKPSGKR